MPRTVTVATAVALAGAAVIVGNVLRKRSRRRSRPTAPPVVTARPACERPPPVPTWLKLGYAVATPVIAGIYWREYGPTNFLWLSDLALGFTAVAVVTEKPLLASMPAVGVLPLEFAWTIDFASGGRVIGLAGYMFEPQWPLWLRGLSLFHLALPPTLLWMLHRFGYDRRALPLQAALTAAVLPLTYALTEPEKNINWVFGPGAEPQRVIPPLAYLALEMAALPLLTLAPMHLALRRLFERAEQAG
jgi:hypothetical protein